MWKGALRAKSVHVRDVVCGGRTTCRFKVVSAWKQTCCTLPLSPPWLMVSRRPTGTEGRSWALTMSVSPHSWRSLSTQPLLNVQGKHPGHSSLCWPAMAAPGHHGQHVCCRLPATPTPLPARVLLALSSTLTKRALPQHVVWAIGRVPVQLVERLHQLHPHPQLGLGGGTSPGTAVTQGRSPFPPGCSPQAPCRASAAVQVRGGGSHVSQPDT